MKLTIEVLGYWGGLYQAKLTRPSGHVSRWEFTLKQLELEIQTAKKHCRDKGYEFELKGIDMNEFHEPV